LIKLKHGIDQDLTKERSLTLYVNITARSLVARLGISLSLHAGWLAFCGAGKSWGKNYAKVVFLNLDIFHHNAIKSCEILYVAFLSYRGTALRRYCKFMGGLLALPGFRPQTARGTIRTRPSFTTQ